MWNYKYLLILTCFAIFIKLSFSDIQCYSCAYNSGEADSNCLTNPSNVENSVLNCTRRYCYSIRVENSGSVSSMYRSCTDSPLYINKLVQYDDVKIYYLACLTPLCNSGTGKEIYGGGAGSGTLYVPGIGYGGSTKTQYTFLTLIITALLCISV